MLTEKPSGTHKTAIDSWTSLPKFDVEKLTNSNNFDRDLKLIKESRTTANGLKFEYRG